MNINRLGRVDYEVGSINKSGRCAPVSTGEGTSSSPRTRTRARRSYAGRFSKTTIIVAPDHRTQTHDTYNNNALDDVRSTFSRPETVAL